MDYSAKACLKQRTRNEYIVKISLVGTVSLAGIGLAIYSMAKANFLFALIYIIAAVMGMSYVIIRINSALPTYIATDGEKLVLSSWDNGIVPYKVGEKSSFFSDFVPAKVKTDEVNVSDIDALIFGSKKFLQRQLEPDKYPEILKKAEEDKYFEKNLRRMDFAYILLKSGDYCFMSITGFDMEDMTALIGEIEKNCRGVKVLTNIPKIVKLRDNMMKA